MRPILALAAKDLTLLVRRPAHLFFTVAWPLIVALVFGMIFGGPSERRARLNVVVADDDRSEASAALVQRLGAQEGVEISTATLEESRDLVRRGQRVAYVHVPAGYGEASERIFYGEPARLEIGLDPSRQAEGAMLEGLLTGAAMQNLDRVLGDRERSRQLVTQALKDLQRDRTTARENNDLRRFLTDVDRFLQSPQPGAAERGLFGGKGWRPVVIETQAVQAGSTGPRNGFEVSFPQGVIWGLIGAAFGFAMSLVFERTRGTLIRLRMAPLAPGTLLAGKALAAFVTLLTVQVLVLGIGITFCGVRVSSWVMLAAAVVALATTFVGLMMFISTLGRTEQTVSGAGWALLLPLSLVGGGMVPLFVMPAWMQKVGNFSPVKWGILALEGATWRSFSPAEMLLPCAILVLFGAAAFTAGAWVLRAEA